ncbi:hypothetical protein F444_14600 [Phytophthora nicotianae P1976]|uniref:MULE transposase domain-containing protein n=1 Tax=Phytophthora nicotianae P1976 TaxID=1317066 RepID=A0A080ZPN7_PHYNI|nr:hypothetical protein F444_14600 [Phytophthora nicotianae P1976]
MGHQQRIPASLHLRWPLATVVLQLYAITTRTVWHRCVSGITAPRDDTQLESTQLPATLEAPDFNTFIGRSDSFTEILPVPPTSVILPTTTAYPSTDPSSTAAIERTTSASTLKEKFQLVSLHESKKTAGVTMRSRDAYVYVYHNNYGKKDNLKRVEYRCESHENRAFRYRVGIYKPVDPHPILEQQMFALEQQGQHNGRPTSRSQYGINRSVNDEVDSLASSGAGPNKILKVLSMKYSDQRNVLWNIPSAEQVKSRKNYLAQGLEAAWKIETFADLCELCSTRMCETAEDFFGRGRGRYGFDMQHDQETFHLESHDFQNDTIVLSCFSHSFHEDGRRKQSFGLVLTSRKLLRNVVYAVHGQSRDGVFVAADGTYRLHYGHWTLVAVGTYRCRYNKRRYIKNFEPWAYMFVRTEHEAAYTKLFRTLFGSFREYCECLCCGVASDRSSRLLRSRGSEMQRKLTSVKRKGLFESNVEVNIQQMHHARSPEQFEAISKLCLTYWREKKEVQYVDWFKKVYLDNRWLNWYTTCAIPGIHHFQNALESHNGVIKKAGITMKQAKTGVVLNDSIPGILTMAAQNAPDRPFGHCCQGKKQSWSFE